MNTMTKRLYRSKNRIVGGVLAGFAEYFDHDPVFWRLGFIVLLFITGLMPFALVYLVAWVLIPEAPQIENLSKEDYTQEEHE
jgi:phage shock protein C